MSIHAHFDKADRIERLDEAPIVLRFEPMFPRDLKRREMHGNRRGGDLTHIRAHLSHLNWQEIGGPDWMDQLNKRIAETARANLQEEIDARTRKGRHKEAREVRERGLVDPWKYTRLGPLREGVLTVNKRWLGGTGLEEWDLRRVFDFLDSAMDFLTANFPGDQLLEVHADVDEEAFHLHFMVGVWVEKFSENRGRQRLLQPSANPLIARYEHAQDVAGEAFLALGIHRGERRAEAVRQALAAGLEVPEPRRHVPPSEWRRAQRRLALEDRDRIREGARTEAAAIVADGVALAKSAVKKSRKRSIAETKARKAEADRQVAAAERDRARAEAQAELARRASLEAEEARKEADRKAEAAREEAARVAQAAQDRAGAIVADGTALATVTVRKSRKRAIAEARTRRAETDRVAAAAEREREAAETRAEQARQAQARAEAEREAAEEAAVAARAEAARVQQAAEAEADRIRTEAAAAAEAEQARADAARRARDEAEAARLAADQAAAEVIGKADAERAEAARATDRAQVVTAGLTALTEEIAAGTLGVREGGRVIARAPDLLRPAYPEIAPAVQAAATVAERTRAARREADAVARATDDAQKKAMDEIARARVVAKSEIDRECDAARTEIENERQALTTELQTKRGELEKQSAELEEGLTRVGWLLNMLERLWPKFVRWLSHPDLPAAIKDEGIGIAAEAVSVLGALRQDDPDP
jgi:hypothetical protein